MGDRSSFNWGQIQATEAQRVRMLAPEVEERLKRYHTQESMQANQCLLRYDDQGPRGEAEPIIPDAGARSVRLYRGTRQNGSYNHHSQIVNFKERYYFAWSNGRVDEEAAGQRILISSSQDGHHWSQPQIVAGDFNDEVVAHNCIALMADAEKLYLVGMHEDTSHDATLPGMRRIEPESQQVYVLSSADGKNWAPAFAFTERLRWIFEAPRETADGRLLCVAAMKDGAAILRWPGRDLCQEPEVINIPEPHGARFPYGEGTWYQTDDGAIVVFWRDEGYSCRAWVNVSVDGGETFTEPSMSDIPDSMSRLSAGRLTDGRFFLCNNAFGTLLNRMHLTLLLSDNGYTFNQVYMVANDPTAQRHMGLLKVNGYQYPCCLPDNNRLLVAHSINKEDIACAIIDTKALLRTA